MFDTNYFVQWFSVLLRQLRENDISNACITMDNASYHKSLPQSTPRRGQKKVVLQNACKVYGIDFAVSHLKSVLWAKLSKYIEANVVPVEKSVAEREGHCVVYTPPHHSNLQPIELVWANTKGAVGLRYEQGKTTFKDVLKRLNDAFAALTSHEIYGCISKANRELMKLHQYLMRKDAADDGQVEEGGGSSEGNVFFGSGDEMTPDLESESESA
ncbi:hypothetical protein LEN26_013606 [Aphanomyces euteiches]|nr:hypothetical protein LEN26_013606 [Aphanomyces euteiches]KAH9111161.1 hypothetical protein AeMF1_014253 [Aphanomyces euteiches]KAH9183902.1 hypothetical protein AeNC1_014124 [Aphanomyces euteiches]